MKTTVSIIIPVYNHAQWISDAISSALNQTVPCGVIVVNDGSPDNTSEVAKMFDVKLIEKENGGLSCRMFALRLAAHQRLPLSAPEPAQK